MPGSPHLPPAAVPPALPPRHATVARDDAGGGPPAPEWPRSMDEISAPWLASLVGAPVTSFCVTPIEEGCNSDLCRVAMTFRDDEPAPRDLRGGCAALPAGASRGDVERLARSGQPLSLVMKMSKSVAAVREYAGQEGGLYDKELHFYRTLAHEVPLATPACYGTWQDGPAGFCIVLEDLSVLQRGFHMITRLPGVAELKDIAGEVARMNAKFFEHPVLSSDAMIVQYPRKEMTDGAVMFPQTFPAATAVFAELYQRPLSNGHVALDEMSETMCSDPARLERLLGRICAQFASRPQTLTHWDCKPDNIFTHTAGAGGGAQYTFIDWQTYTAAPLALELGQLLQTTLEPGDAARVAEVQQHYYARVCELNPAVAAAYPFAHLVEDFQANLILFWCALAGYVAARVRDLALAAPEQRALWDAMYTRLPAVMEHSGVHAFWAARWADTADGGA